MKAFPLEPIEKASVDELRALRCDLREVFQQAVRTRVEVRLGEHARAALAQLVDERADLVRALLGADAGHAERARELAQSPAVAQHALGVGQQVGPRGEIIVLVVGVGVNVRTERFPPAIASRATSRRRSAIALSPIVPCVETVPFW